MIPYRFDSRGCFNSDISMGNENQKVKTAGGESLCESSHCQFMYSQLPKWCFQQVALQIIAFLPLIVHPLTHVSPLFLIGSDLQSLHTLEQYDELLSSGT